MLRCNNPRSPPPFLLRQMFPPSATTCMVAAIKGGFGDGHVRQGMAERSGSPDRGGLSTIVRHASDPPRSTAISRHHAVSQRRKFAPDRQPQAPPGPIIVPLRVVQRLDRARDHGYRGIIRLDRGIRSVFCTDAWPALHRGGPRQHRPAQARCDPLSWRRNPRGRRPTRSHRGFGATGGGVWRALRRSVHLCGTCY